MTNEFPVSGSGPQYGKTCREMGAASTPPESTAKEIAKEKGGFLILSR